MPTAGTVKPPNISGQPIRKNPTKPRPKMAKFVETTWAACLARQKPVSTRANPACMKITRMAPRITQSRLTWVPRTWVSVGSWAPATPSVRIRPIAVAPRVTAPPTATFFSRFTSSSAFRGWWCVAPWLLSPARAQNVH